MALIYCYGKTPHDDNVAKECAESLVLAYPNHSWWVECRDGLIIIKHFAISGARGTIGMVRRLTDLGGDAKRRKQECLRGAGELLERAGLPRGANTGEPVFRVELDKSLAKHWRPAINPVKVIH